MKAPTVQLGLLLLSACSCQDTTLAFVHPAHPYIKATSSTSAAQRSGGEYHGGIASSCKPKHRQQQQLAVPLRARTTATATPRASSSTTKLSSTSSIDDDDDGTIDREESLEAANQALQSMKFCYQMCFLSVAADIASTLIDGTVRPKVFGLTASTASWADYTGILSGLVTPLVFGCGLWYITRLYYESYLRSMEDFDQRMTQENLISLFATKSWIWGLVALNVALASVSLGAAMPELCAEGPWPALWESVAPEGLALGVMGILGVGGVAVRKQCDDRAGKEIMLYRGKNSNDAIVGEEEEERETMMDLDVIRAAGFQAYFNQALCAGSFGVMGGLQLFKWTASFDDNYVGHAMSVFDFIEPFALCSLLFLLNEALVRATVAEVVGDRSSGEEGASRADNHYDEVHYDLCVAGSEFYDKVGSTLKGAAIFHLLPYVAIPAATFALKALKEVRFFANALELPRISDALKSFGIDIE